MAFTIWIELGYPWPMSVTERWITLRLDRRYGTTGDEACAWLAEALGRSPQRPLHLIDATGEVWSFYPGTVRAFGVGHAPADSGSWLVSGTV